MYDRSVRGAHQVAIRRYLTGFEQQLHERFVTIDPAEPKQIIVGSSIDKMHLEDTLPSFNLIHFLVKLEIYLQGFRSDRDGSLQYAGLWHAVLNSDKPIQIGERFKRLQNFITYLETIVHRRIRASAQIIQGIPEVSEGERSVTEHLSKVVSSVE